MIEALYRRWRPQNFDSVKGQDAIRDTLVSALNHDGLSHAYLFCGPRGTGKTTTARLIAKTINCTSDDKTKPCNECASCLSINDGSNIDITEIDAASNRGIDDIRGLREKVQFRPTQAKYKVFIIDEVHMLTREAFNALLKTLEEPPTQTVFILATTEAQKVPATIVSRCQRYDFKRANIEVLAERVLEVAKAEKIKLDESGARFLARLADGSFRDALSQLEQASQSAGSGVELNQPLLEKLFGYVPEDLVNQCIVGALSGDLLVAHKAVDAIVELGADLATVMKQLLFTSEKLLESKIIGSTELLGADLAAFAPNVNTAKVLEWMEQLMTALGRLKQSPIPRLPLDMAIAKMEINSRKLEVRSEKLGTEGRGSAANSNKPEDGSLKPEKDSGENSKKREVGSEKVVEGVDEKAADKEETEQKPNKVEEKMGAGSREQGAEHSKEELELKNYEENEEVDGSGDTAVRAQLPAPSVVETETVEVLVALPSEVTAEEWKEVMHDLAEESPSLLTCLSGAKCGNVVDGILEIETRYKMHADKLNQPKNRDKIEASIDKLLHVPLKINAVHNKELTAKTDESDTMAMAAEVFELQDAI